MAGSILDYSRLIGWWQRKRPQNRGEARKRAQDLIAIYHTNQIITPVRLEFLCGARGDDLDFCDVFLSQFQVIDEGKILPEDWDKATQYGRRSSSHPRHAMDCLIRAVAERLHCEVLTSDKNFPRKR